MAKDSTSGAADELFVRDLTCAQSALQAYLFVLIGREEDVRDVLQETNLRLWKNRADFTPGTSFVAWAKTVALWQVRTYRKKVSRGRLVFDDALFQMLAEDVAERMTDDDRRVVMLESCVKKLNEQQRLVVSGRYFEDLSIPEIAGRAGISPAGAVCLLYRVRRLLADCVRRALHEEDRQWT